MNWFEQLAENVHIEAVLIADNQGHILRSTRTLRSDHEQVASMVLSFEAMAQALAETLGCGDAQMVQFATDLDHILIFPLLGSTYFLVAQVPRKAPLMLLMVELERVMAQLEPSDFVYIEELAAYADDTPVLDAAELIDAVREWLQNQQPR